MANPFDEFDPKPGSKEPNPFDAFDERPAIVPTGGLMDEYFSTGTHGHILDLFGEGFKQGWGSEPLGMAPETEQFFKDAGIFKDIQKGQTGLIRGFNEAVMRGAAMDLDVALRFGMGIYHGLGNVGMAAGLPRDVAALPEAFPAGRATGFPGRIVPPEITIEQLAAARDLGIIGSGEEGWKGTGEIAPPIESPESVKALSKAAPETEPQLAPPTAPAQPNIHEVVRQKAPELFSEYDALSARRDTFRQWLDDMKGGKSVRDLEDQIDALRGQRLEAPAAERRDLANRITKMENERNALAEQLQAGTDTPEMARVREALQETDYRMRDLAPEVSAAYRAAAEPIAPPETPAATPAAPAGEPTPPAPPEMAQPETLPVAGPQAIPVQAIAADVTKQLGLAGQPADQASAAAAIVQAYYETRAARLGGKVTAEQLYEQDAPTIRHAAAGGRGGAAQGRTVLKDGRAIITLFDKADASTFMHESAHQWLDQMMRDATDDRAVESLRQDAGSVREWLGAKGVGLPAVPTGSVRFYHGGSVGPGSRWVSEDRAYAEGYARDRGGKVFYVDIPEAELERRGIAKQFDDAGTGQRAPYVHWDVPEEIARDLKPVTSEAPITTRQHEKFARAFEQYLMEGRAPTRALVNVFDQFKQWLTKIYESMSRLGRPINDDIRSLFDRLLTTTPERAILAEEREPFDNFAGIHERDAETTPPEQAEPVADAIRAERDRAADRLPPELDTDRRVGRGDTEAPAGGAGGGLPAGGGSSGRAESGRPGAPAEYGEVGPRGVQAAIQRPTANAEPAGPSASFVRPAESALIDRAGNIRLDNLGTPEDVNLAIREAAETNEDFIGARRGIVSDAQVLDLAEALGMTADALLKRKVGEAFNAEQVVAARKLLIHSATEVRDLMAKAADGTDEDVIAYAEGRARHQMIQEQVAGLTAEAGRALRAFKALGETTEAKEISAVDTFIKGATGRDLYQLRKEAQAGYALYQTPQQVSKYINDAKKPDYWDKILFYRANMLISGPATHSTYLVANEMLALYRSLETGVGAAIGGVRQLFGGAEERAYLGEVLSGLYGFFAGHKKGIMAAGEGVRTGVTKPLPGEGPLATYGAGILPYQPIGGIAGATIGVPGRIVTGIHNFNRVIGYEQHLHALAYRQAASEGLLSDTRASRIADLISDPPEGMMTEAAQLATDQSLVGRTGEFTNWLVMLSNKRIAGVPLVKLAMPFIRIGSNIMSQAFLERTPLGVLDQSIRDNLMGRNGVIARDMQYARIVTGTALGAAVMGMVGEGLFTGGGPSNPDEAALWRQTGKRPYSIRIGDHWHSLHRLGPLALLTGLYADAYELAHAASDDTLGRFSQLMFHSIQHNIMGESWLRGVSDLVKATQDGNFAKRYASEFLATFMPFSIFMSQMARATDPYMREAHGLIDTLKSKTPFLSRTLLPRRDIWGEPIPNDPAFPMSGISAIYTSRVNNDPVNPALEKLNLFPHQPDRHIRGVKLTDEQYDDYRRMAGRMAKARLDALYATPGFAETAPEHQRKAVMGTIEHAREGARKAMMMQNPQIKKDAAKAKTARLRGEKVH